MKIFSFNPGLNGSYIDPISGVAGVNTNGEFVNTDKGKAWKGNGVDSKVLFTTPINLKQDWTIEVYGKINKDSIGNTWVSYMTISDIGLKYVAGGSVTPKRILFAEDDGLTPITENYDIPIEDTEWHHIVYVHNISTKTITAYVDNIWSCTEEYSGNLFSDSTHVSIGYQDTGSGWLNGLVAKASIDNHAFTPQERAKAYKKFLSASPRGKEILPRLNVNTFKSIDLSKEVNTGLVAAYNFIKPGLVDISGQGNNAILTGTTSTNKGLNFDGIDDKAVLGDIGNIKTVAMRIKLNSSTEKIIEGQSADKLIHVNSGTLTYADFENAYIDGVDSNSIFAGNWTTVVIMSSTDVDFSACTLGFNDATYGKFEIADLKFYSYMFTENNAIDYHNSFIKPTLIADFKNDPVGSTKPYGFIQGSGGYEVKEMTSQDSVLKELDNGTKYLESTGNGTIILPLNDGYGTYEFSFIKEGASTSIMIHLFANDKVPAVADNWTFLIDSGEVMYLSDPSTTHFTIPSFVTTGIWYRAKLELNGDGSGSFYIKGGVFGSVYRLIGDFTGGEIISDAKYILINNDSGDSVADIIVHGGGNLIDEETVDESPVSIYDDWFLPSANEVIGMYDNLYAFGVGGFEDTNYWTSSELTGGEQYNAFILRFNTGVLIGAAKASSPGYHVRACRSFTAEIGAYVLRDIGPAGGLIFYIDDAGTTYYEAAPLDQSTDYAWSNIREAINTTGIAIGTGQANTTLIIGQDGHTESAAKLCDDLSIAY